MTNLEKARYLVAKARKTAGPARDLLYKMAGELLDGEAVK